MTLKNEGTIQGGYAYLERPNATLLARLGYRVLRVEAARVVGDLAGVVAEISAALPEEGRRGG